MLGHLVSNNAVPAAHAPLSGWLKKLIAFLFRQR